MAKREAPAWPRAASPPHLGLTPGTVATMMKHLSKEGFIDVPARAKEFASPASGEQLGLQIVRRHRLVELFLVEVMQLHRARVHEEAEVLEHVLSDRMVERIDDDAQAGQLATLMANRIPDAEGLLRRDDDPRPHRL